MSKLQNRYCAICGTEFNPYMGNQVYCSKRCRDDAINAKIRAKRAITSPIGKPTACAVCGRQFIRSSSTHKYCSDKCKDVGSQSVKAEYLATKKPQNYDRDRWRKIRGSQEYTKECIVCGKTFKTWYPQKITCSDECKKVREKQYSVKYERLPLRAEKAHAKYIKRQYGSEEAHQKYLAELKKKKQEQMEQTRRKREVEKEARRKANLIFGECVVCGNAFKTYNRQQKTCSKECGKKLSYARKQSRIPKNQMIDKDITLEALYRRDSGVCYLCGKPCDWSDKEGFVVGANYPSIDHIVPVSRGGLHAWNNVRLAHFRCNVDKSDEIIPEAKKMIPKNAYEFKRDVKPRKKKTLQFTKDNQFLAEYESTAEAERQTGTKQRGIQKCASGQCKSYGGFIWRYA